MKQYTDEEIKKLDEEYYNSICEENINWTDLAEKVNSLNHADKIYFQTKMLDECLRTYCGGYAFYPKKSDASYKEMRQIILNTVEYLPKDYYLWWGVYYYFRDDKINLEKFLNKWFAVNNDVLEENPFNENDFVEIFIDIYKNAYKGFWKKLSARFKKCNNVEAENLCNLFEDFYYNCATDEEKENLLLDYIQKNPDTVLAKEFLGFLYEDMRRWYNGIQLFEQVKDNSCFYYYKDIYFQLAWCYGKVKEYAAEEENYRKCLELEENYTFALNNLGWSLYKQKKFNEAEKIFLKCLEEEREEEEKKYSANNLVRIYLKTGQIERAKKLIASGKFKISNDLIKKVKNYSPKSFKTENDSDEGVAENKKIIYGDSKRQQFSSEKILEDEIVTRIESGQEIFGLKLKIYRRKGDYYGRQYPFAEGRLDILCEDAQDNFYIIELKKDGGYSDVYQQIKNYVDYFEKNRVQKGKKVFGIICLNSPPEKLLEDVRRDKRIRLFEYKISYGEIF